MRPRSICVATTPTSSGDPSRSRGSTRSCLSCTDLEARPHDIDEELAQRVRIELERFWLTIGEGIGCALQREEEQRIGLACRGLRTSLRARLFAQHELAPALRAIEVTHLAIV